MSPAHLVYLRAVISVAAPVLTLIGVFLSAYGTYDLTRSYYPIEGITFARVALRVSFLFATFRFRQAHKRIDDLSDYAVNSEDRNESLAGLFLIFWGFVIGGVGTFCWIIDAIWGAYAALHPSVPTK